MGLIRVILALSVFGSHYHIHPDLAFAGPVVAVKFFYMISGFYMAMILQENYYPSIKNFYKSRFLRLYPIYLIFTLACLFGNFGNTIYGRNIISDNLSLFPSMAITFANLFIVGQDVLFFFGINGNSLNFVTDYNISDPYPIYKYFYTPQAFSLSIEIFFYAIAPFVIKKKNYTTLFVLFFLSIFLRFFLINIGLKGDPWSSRFFFNELSFFLLGAFGYNLYKENFFIKNLHIKITIYFFSIVILLIYSTIPNLEILPGTYIFFNDIIIFIFFTFFIGTIFDLHKSSKIDRIIGETSYPIYCSHLVIIGITKVLNILNDVSYLNTIILYLVTILISFLIYFIIQIPVDKYREKYKI